MGFVYIFAFGENKSSARSSPRRQQSAGLLHLIVRIPHRPFHKENPSAKQKGFLYGVGDGIRTHEYRNHNPVP